MKVALYYPWIYLTSGAERTILELTAHSRHQWTIFTNRFDSGGTFPEFAQRDVRELARVPVKRTVAAAMLGLWKIVSQQLPLDSHDALVVVCEGFGDMILFRNRSTPAINLCLTPLRLSFDEIYRRRCFANRGFIARMTVRLGALLFRVVDRLAWKRYRRIICISSEVKRRAVHGHLAKTERIEVAHVGLGFASRTPSDRFDQFFLIAGRIMWTKDIEVGIEGFLAARKKSEAVGQFRLVVAGMVDRKSEPYLEKLRSLSGGTGNGIEFRTKVSDQELAELYRSCYATIFTAFNEDWGIVPLESMSFGKPVICSNRGGPREFMADGRNGFLVEPSPEAFAAKIRELAENPELCRTMGLAGPQTSQAFSWQTFADVMDKAIDQVAKSGPFKRPEVDAAPEAVSVRQ